jgi:hypothetical protein
MYDGDSARWDSELDEKLWALADSDVHSTQPCDSFLWFSKARQAFIVQTTSPAPNRWQWDKECSARLFVMKYFEKTEAKALRSVIIECIPFILFDFTLKAPF